MISYFVFERNCLRITKLNKTLSQKKFVYCLLFVFFMKSANLSVMLHDWRQYYYIGLDNKKR
jgi:hypothetical protein